MPAKLRAVSASAATLIDQDAPQNHVVGYSPELLLDYAAERLQAFGTLITRRLADSGFVLFSRFAERHGAFELQLQRASGLTTDLISIACELSPEDPHVFEVWSSSSFLGAEEHFARALAGTVTIADLSALTPQFEQMLADSVAACDLQGDSLRTRFLAAAVHDAGLPRQHTA